MDVSPVQSSAKCGSSDFSIERILSNDTVNKKEQSVEAPSWLCCTRYQPPRLPRSTSASCRSRRSGRHARVPFTAAQAAALEAAYARAPYLAPPALRALAAALQLRDDRIKIWFQNRRARERREKSSIIAVPHEVTLPPTTLNPQGLLAVGRPWISQASKETNTKITSPSHSTSHTSEPQDLSMDFIYSSSSDMRRDDDSNRYSDGERPDSPLDIESID